MPSSHMPIKTPDYVTRRDWMIGGIIVGAALAATLAAVVILILLFGTLHQTEISNNRERIEHEHITNRRQSALLRELRAITHPTPRQYRRQLREGIRRCLREPSCRRLFPQIQNDRASARSSVVPTTPVRTPGSTSPTVRKVAARGEAKRSHPAPERRSPSPTSSGPPAASPATPPSNPSSVATATVPLPVAICSDVIRVNC